jgi:nucleotide-binding universal stress UspA family protein
MKTIIVPTDFSETAGNAVKYALQMSKMHSYKLVFVHVYSLPFLNPEAGMVYDASFSAAMKAQAEKALRENIDTLFESLGMHRNLLLTELEVVEAISLAGGIENINHKYNSNFVIMGTHGATGLKKFFLGSNAVDVIENTAFPVLTIPSDVEFSEIKQIAYASDFKNMEVELKEVINFAKSFTAHVEVIHVAKDNESVKIKEIDPLFKQWQALNNYDNMNLHLLQSSSSNTTTGALKSILNDISADILVMFHKDRNFWKSMFEKSTTTELVYEWSAPILTMHKK